MKKHGFSVVLILLLLTGLIVTMGAAGDDLEEVRVRVWQSGTYVIQPGQVAVLRAGWAACNPGLVRVFTRASNWTVTLDGTVILTPDDVDGLWGQTEIYDPPPAGFDICVGEGRPASSEWRYPLSDLGTGPHELVTSMQLDHMLIDGADYDGDGIPDQFAPASLAVDTVNTITVEP